MNILNGRSNYSNVLTNHNIELLLCAVLLFHSSDINHVTCTRLLHLIYLKLYFIILPPITRLFIVGKF